MTTGLTRTRAEDRKRAYAVFHGALRRGDVRRPKACQGCQKPPRRGYRLQAHHGDYSKPLDVEWLCGSCHSLRRRAVLMEYDIPDAMREAAKREGISLRALILGWLKEWVEK